MKTNSYSELLKILPVQSTEAIMSTLSILPLDLREFLRKKFSEEGDKFVADPVFEPMFSYKPSQQTFGELSGKLLPRSFVNALHGASEYRFDKSMYPYQHQLTSWETLLNTNNSLVVSSGTGSGKTECFMIPIISDLVQQVEKTNSVLEGVQALFIYPLNALIQNQRERFSEWTKPYKGNIRYCLYNGLLPQQTRESEQKETVEEVVDREQLWKSPSPLLITNTTMLEYMLIRANDKRIIDKSKGKLKYIVLDEAHTYIGSQAAELSLLLKRVMDAFEVKPEQVKFIATSATIGDNDASTQLRRFLSSISGVNEENVTVVFGKNEIEPLASSTAGKSIDEIEKIENPDEIIKELRNNKLACSLRSFFISSNTEHGVARTLTEICNNFNLTSDLALRWLDLLSVTPVNEKSFLPLRLHIFHKTFPGLWSCCNPNCTCKDNIPGWKFGKIYFKEQCKCECGAPVFRVKACANCGEPFLEAKINDSAKDGKKYLYPTMLQDIDEFSLDDDDNYINDVEAHTVWVENFEKDNDTACYLNIEDSSLSLANSNGIRLNVFEDYEDIHCCDAPEVDQIKSFIPLQGAPFVLSHVLPTLLNYAEIAKDSESKPHAGQKMICFTDSRQGTARLAVQLQQNSERNSFRSILLHVIAHIEAENNKNNNADQINTLKEAYKSTKMPQLLDMIKQLEGQKGSSFANENNVISDILKEFDDNDLKWIYNYYRDKDSIFDTNRGQGNLIEILFARELIRRPKKANNVETLGLLATAYDFSKITSVPASISKYFTCDDWKNYLKIVLDFFVRANGFVEYPENWDKWGAISKNNEPLDFDHWPKADKKKKNRNIVKLLFYALDMDQTNDYHIDIVNEIMKEAWLALTSATGILTPSANQIYRMKMDKIGLRRLQKIYVCPITNKALDVTFKGYSPYLSRKNRGESKEITLEKCKEYSFPIYDYSKESGKSYDECVLMRREWLENNDEINELKKLGIWNNITNSIILGNRYFRTAEHSAQQTHSTLKRYEDDFKIGKINVLNCSTTMEMGVDIGGITISSMNNVPPHPANYLQRAGRAGRRSETKAISFTLCKDNSHDQYVFAHPKWAFSTKIAAPYVDKYSFIVLQRHINSLLLAYYFDSIKGQITDATKLNMEWFMLPAENSRLIKFKQFCKDAIRVNDRIRKAISSIIENTHYEDINLDVFVTQLDELIDNLQKRWYAEYDAIQEQKEREKDRKISLAAIKKTEERLLKEYILKELIEYGLLPRYGFPTNIVTFDTNNRFNLDKKVSQTREDNLFKRRELPSRDICTALREYAPGCDVVIDGLVYKSAGITLNWHIPASDSEVKEIQSMRYIWRCHKCGASGTSTSLCDVKCDVCGSEIDTRDMQKYIQPAGFSVDFNAAVNNNVSVQRYINICEPLVTAHNTLNSYLGLPYVKYKNDKEGSVIHYSNGGGEGYILCLECGRMVANNKKNREEFKKRHYRLRSGVYPNSQTGNTYKVECQHSPYSIIENINLGVEIKTDLLELILSDLDGNVIDDRTLAYSLAVAIRSGIAKYMNVETEEIGCIAKQIRVNGTNKKGFAIELFDKNASGYCSSNDIIKNLNIIFKYAQNILKCDCAQSCNKCILQNDTKYNYRYLDRKLALEFLTDEWIAKNTLPQDMKIFGDGILVASASIESLIEDTPNLQKLYLIIPENMENEDFSNSPIYRLVNRYNALNTQIILCVNEKTLGDDVKKTISLLSNLSNVSVKAIPEKLNDKIMAIVWDGFKYYSYASFDENVRQLNQYWGSNINTSILSGYIDINGLKFNDVKLETVENISYDKMFNISSEVNGPGYGFGNRLLSILASSLDKGISSPIVKIEYKDRYLKNPLASGLFYSFIKELKVRYEKLWNCASITLETAETTETNKQYPTMFYHDWDDVDARNEVLTALFDKIGLKFQLKEKNKKYLEHNRIMTIELENGEKINLILDQGFSYWRCLAYCYAENIFPFDADIDEQVAKIGQWLPNVSGDTYPTRIFYTKSK